MIYQQNLWLNYKNQISNKNKKKNGLPFLVNKLLSRKLIWSSKMSKLAVFLKLLEASLSLSTPHLLLLCFSLFFHNVF